MLLGSRVVFASRYAGIHLLASCAIALLSAAVVFGLWYVSPYRQMLDIGGIYGVVLIVDIACGPLLTLILSNPSKSSRERWLDFSLIGLIQIAALVYGMYAVWIARPVVLAFEVDRLVVVTANEVQTDSLFKAPLGMRQLPWAGVWKVATRGPANNEEYLRSVDLGLAGISPAMLPDWWIPWADAHEAMRAKSKPLASLIARRPQDAQTLRDAAKAAGTEPAALFYLPLTSRKVKEWVALLDAGMNVVGYASVDGFD